MQEANKKFRRIFKDLEQTLNVWDEAHTESCKIFTNITNNASRISNVMNKDNYGVLTDMPNISTLLQAQLVENIEKKFNEWRKVMLVFEDVIDDVGRIEMDAQRYFRGNFPKLSTALSNAGMPDSSQTQNLQDIAEYLQYLRDIQVMYRKELLHKKYIIDQVDYAQSNSLLSGLYSLYSSEPRIQRSKGKTIFFCFALNSILYWKKQINLLSKFYDGGLDILRVFDFFRTIVANNRLANIVS
eukprot:gb/GECH01009730.1/.p1 GENE.gb/GECH01009730.1/~~gb/GECH01009730.1/.p1  ORF type:complete len:242 (+),score=44.98 gb/GECH01009730.1/:1-726(+)